MHWTLSVAADGVCSGVRDNDASVAIQQTDDVPRTTTSPCEPETVAETSDAKNDSEQCTVHPSTAEMLIPSVTARSARRDEADEGVATESVSPEHQVSAHEPHEAQAGACRFCRLPMR